jgi:general secretion pathway protein G
MQSRSRKAFTLVEILIVVVILGILAAIVIPQFTNASQDAQRGNIQTQLQSIRNQIELYRVKNNGVAPILVGAGGTGGTAFSQMLTPPGTQQPYLRNMPANPRVPDSTSATTVQTGSFADNTALNNAAKALDPAATAYGWIYDQTTGRFAAAGFDETTNKWFGEP